MYWILKQYGWYLQKFWRIQTYWLYLMIWLLICLLIKKLNPIVTELFVRERKLNIYLDFITFPKNIRLNSTHCFVIKIPSKRNLQHIAFNSLSDIDFKNFMNLFKKYTAEPYSFLVSDTTLASDNSSCFRKNLLERI